MVAGLVAPVAARWDSGTRSLCQRVLSAARPSKTIGYPTAHSPEGTGEGCPDELSTDVCDLFDLSHEGLGTIATTLAMGSLELCLVLHDGEMRGEATRNNSFH